jgi:hypothetical protein
MVLSAMLSIVKVEPDAIKEGSAFEEQKIYSFAS